MIGFEFVSVLRLAYPQLRLNRSRSKQAGYGLIADRSLQSENGVGCRTGVLLRILMRRYVQGFLRPCRPGASSVLLFHKSLCHASTLPVVVSTSQRKSSATKTSRRFCSPFYPCRTRLATLFLPLLSAALASPRRLQRRSRTPRQGSARWHLRATPGQLE